MAAIYLKCQKWILYGYSYFKTPRHYFQKIVNVKLFFLVATRCISFVEEQNKSENKYRNKILRLFPTEIQKWPSQYLEPP